MIHKKNNYKNLKWLFLSILLALLDVGTKYWIQCSFYPGEILYIFPGINFYYICNAGLAFGIFSDFGMCYRWVFVWMIIIIVMVFIFVLYQSISPVKYYNLSYSIIIGGALGNLCDRILHGVVIDFIDIYVGIWHWPIFNVADMEIFVGIIILVMQHFYSFGKNKH